MLSWKHILLDEHLFLSIMASLRYVKKRLAVQSIQKTVRRVLSTFNISTKHISSEDENSLAVAGISLALKTKSTWMAILLCVSTFQASSMKMWLQMLRGRYMLIILQDFYNDCRPHAVYWTEWSKIRDKDARSFEHTSCNIKHTSSRFLLIRSER